MSSIVCNCNSFGNVDYGMPLSFDSPDYRTSTGRALRHIPPISYEYNSIRHQLDKAIHLGVKLDNYTTQNVKIYDRKYHKWIRPGKPDFPAGIHKTHFMRDIKEKMYKNPPIPKKSNLVEYKDQYYEKSVEEPLSIPQNFEDKVLCKVSSTGKGEQPRIKSEEPSITKHLDIYLTTNQKDYIPFSLKQLDNAKTNIITFYDTETSPLIKMSNHKKPINDETLFKKVIKDRAVPTLVYRVPFTGKTSEYKGNYGPPTKACMFSHIFDVHTVFGDSLSKPNLVQSLTAPNMYCTEYCHIGTGRSVCTAVNRIYEKKVTKHPQCNE